MIWEPGYSFHGGHTPSMLYMLIDFDKPATETPVSYYKMYVIKGTERIPVAEIPGNYDFSNKSNVNQVDKGEVPDNY